MSGAAILKRIEKINVWKKGDQRAPHKPLLVLYALGLWQRGRKDISFREAEPDLKNLLQRFGRPRRSDHPEQPFWRLQRNRVWTVHAPANMPLKAGKDIPTVGALRGPAVRGEFSPDVQAALSADPALATKIANLVLERHFPDSLHQEILDAVNLSTETATRKKRDARVREKVLDAYQGRCAVCDFDVRVADVLVGIDAAHIRWHQFNGPATEENGLALCVMHHKLFDFGAFTVREGRFRVSSKAGGTSGFKEHLLAFHCREIRKPLNPAFHPDADNLAWHAREVFKGEELPCI